MKAILLNITSALTGLTFPYTPVALNNVVYDTESVYNPAKPGVIIIPAGVGWARLSGGIALPLSGATGSSALNIWKNGAEVISAYTSVRNSNSGYGDNQNMSITPWLPVVAGDEFSLRLNVTGLGNPTSIIVSARTYFSGEFK